MTTQTTDLSELITPAVVAYLSDQKPVQDLVGRTPTKIFGGAVPEEINGSEVKFPYVVINEGEFDEEMCLTGGTGCFRANLIVSSIAETVVQARKIHATLRRLLSAKYSVTWNSRLFVAESQFSAGQQVPIMLPDGYPAPQQQIVGELFLLCKPLAVT